MHYYFVFFLCFSLLFLPQSLQATGITEAVAMKATQTSQELYQRYKHFFSIEYSPYTISYIERKNYKQLMSIKGTLPRYGLTFSRPFLNRRSFLSFSLNKSLGVTHYEGSYIGNDTTSVSRLSFDSLLEQKALIGYYAGNKNQEFYYLYTGYYYRNWTNRIHGQGAYKRKIKGHFLPIGLRVSRQLSATWYYQFFGEFLYLLHAQNDTYLFETNPFIFPYSPNSYITFNQNDGFGLHTSLTMYRNISYFKLGLGMYYTFFYFNDSETVLTFYEPENKTREIGIKLSLSPLF